MQTNSSDKDLKVSIIEDGLTVFEFLNKALGCSRSLIKKYSFNKKYLEKKIKKRELLTLPASLVNSNLISPVFNGDKIDIIYEDEKFIIINKPFGVHGHPLSYSDDINILSFLRSRYNLSQLGLNSKNRERGLLYRLDSVTSGLLIFCKDENYALKLRANFHDQVTSKIYLCIVEGNFKNNGGHTHYFQYSGKKRSLAKVSAENIGDKAIFDVESLSYNQSEKLSLLKVSLKTGLRHQIRAQLSYMGFPILGDQLYGGSPSNRVFLHAYKYCLKDLEGHRLSFQCLNAQFFDCYFSKEINSLDDKNI